MKIKDKIFVVLAIFILAIALVSAIDFNPNGDIELRNLWKIKNATSITTQNLTVSGTLIAPIYNSTYAATSADVSANRSDWFSKYNSTYAATSADVTANRSNFLSTYNSTYHTWAYNQTAPANSYADSLLITTFFNASTILNVTGVSQGTIGDIRAYDSLSYNVSEVNSDIDFRVNFTGITTFNQLIVRYKSDSTESHTMTIDLWNYVEGTWESYRTVGNSPDYNIMTMAVFDEAEHISGGVVQVRFYSNNAGGSTHKHQFDWVAISKGSATPSSSETDPYSVHKDGTTPLTGNWNAGLFNITADYHIGKLDWTNLTNFPVACPAGSFVSTLGTTVTCTTPSINATSNSSVYWYGMSSINTTQMQNNNGVLNILESWVRGIITGYGYLTTVANNGHTHALNNLTAGTLTTNLPMNANNITNVSYVKYANATSNSAWIAYVNASNSFIIEVSA